MRFNSKVFFVIAIFSLSVLLSWVGFVLAKRVLSHSSYRYISFYSADPSALPQVLLIGNSRAGSNFSDAAFLPGDLLNLGMGGMTFQMLSLQAIDMIEVNPKLKFVVIEPYFLRDKYIVVRQGHIQALFSDRVKKQVWLLFTDFEKLITTIFPSYWLNTNNFIGAFGNAIIDGRASQGYDERTLDLGRFGEARMQRIAAQTYGGIDSKTIKQLSDLNQECKKSGVSLLMIVSPIHNLRSESHGWKTHKSEIEKIANKLGIKFYDFSTILDGERMFVDTVHLNSAGAAYMSKVLLLETLGNERSP